MRRKKLDRKLKIGETYTILIGGPVSYNYYNYSNVLGKITRVFKNVYYWRTELRRYNDVQYDGRARTFGEAFTRIAVSNKGIYDRVPGVMSYMTMHTKRCASHPVIKYCNDLNISPTGRIKLPDFQELLQKVFMRIENNVPARSIKPIIENLGSNFQKDGFSLDYSELEKHVLSQMNSKVNTYG